MKADRHPLPCSCCQRPFAELIRLHNGQPALLVLTRHRAGEKHANVLTLEQVKQMLEDLDKAGECDTMPV